MSESIQDSDRRLAQVMEKAAGDYQAQRTAEERTRTRRERNQRAVRQFLLFLLFFVVAAAFIFRNGLGRALLAVDGTTEEAQAETRPRAGERTMKTIQFVSEQADRRHAILDEIQ